MQTKLKADMKQALIAAVQIIIPTDTVIQATKLCFSPEKLKERYYMIL